METISVIPSHYMKSFAYGSYILFCGLCGLAAIIQPVFGFLLWKVISSVADKAKLYVENFSKNSSLDYFGSFLLDTPSRTNKVA